VIDFSINSYADQAMSTAVYPGRLDDGGLNYAVVGLCGEAGELANQMKKVLRDDAGKVTPGRRNKMIDELGDILWYCAAVADEIGVSLSYVAGANLSKLQERKQAGTLHGDARVE
jgi:NTP pyrophosphatase (non-canonical NTP hydrolase)